MRYTATLQRFDDAHVDVAQGDDRAAVIAAATAVYTALIPSIRHSGNESLRQQARSEHDYEREDARELRRDGISGSLRAQEWGVGVYDREATQGNIPDLIFWVGATREKPSL